MRPLSIHALALQGVPPTAFRVNACQVYGSSAPPWVTYAPAPCSQHTPPKATYSQVQKAPSLSWTWALTHHVLLSGAFSHRRTPPGCIPSPLRTHPNTTCSHVSGEPWSTLASPLQTTPQLSRAPPFPVCSDPPHSIHALHGLPWYKAGLVLSGSRMSARNPTVLTHRSMNEPIK